MNLKKLTQAVFEGLPKEYRWAAVDADGETCAYEVKPDCQADIGRWTRPESRGGLKSIKPCKTCRGFMRIVESNKCVACEAVGKKRQERIALLAAKKERQNESH